MKAIIADITKLKNVEVIVNAANGKGIMGRGVAGAISYAGGLEFRNQVREICNKKDYKEGDCFISTSGELEKIGIKAVYHAVTMEFPASRTSIDTITKAMRKTLDTAIANGVQTIAFPGLGTGVGSLNPKSAAIAMFTIAKAYNNQIDITICDINEQFIGYVKELIENQRE